MRRGLLLFLAVALCAWAAPNAGALTRTPDVPASHYDEAVAVLVVVLGDGITLDTFEGIREDPLSLHKYVYCADNPVNRIDPSGQDPLSAALNGQIVHRRIAEDFVGKVPGGMAGPAVSTILTKLLPAGTYIPQIALFPDLVDTQNKKLYEIKPILSFPLGVAQLKGYIDLFNYFDPKKGWTAGTKYDYQPPSKLYIGLYTWADVHPPNAGVILYDVVDIPSLTLIAVGAISTVSTAEMTDLTITEGVAALNALMGGF